MNAKEPFPAKQTSSVIRILIADDHPIVRAGLRSILDADSQIEVVGEVDCAEEVLSQYKVLRPDLLLLDLSIPQSSCERQSSPSAGLELIRKLTARYANAKILVVSMSDRSPIPERALESGARGYVLKDDALEELLDAIRTVFAGDIFCSAVLEQALREQSLGSASQRLALLTKRELEIFMHLASGESPMNVGERLKLSHKTVHAHRASILKKLGLKSNTDLVRFGIDAGVVYT